MKNAQIHSQVFMYILSGLIAALLIVFSSSLFGSVKEKVKDATVLQLDNKMRSSVEMLSSDFGAVQELNLELPQATDKICFVNLDQKDTIADGPLGLAYPSIKKRLESANPGNVFLLSKNGVTNELNPGKICLQRPFYKCLYTGTNVLTVAIQGKNKCVDIIRPLSTLEINNLKNDDKYINQPIFVMMSDAGEENLLRMLPLVMWNNRQGQIKSYPFYVYYEHLPGEINALAPIAEKNPSAKEIRFIGSAPSGLIGTQMINGHEIRVTDDALGSYYNYWDQNNMVDIVVVDPGKEDAKLIASLFASYLIAPIIFANSGNLEANKPLLENKRIFVVDGVDSIVNQYINDKSRERIDYDSSYLRMDKELNPYIRLLSNVTPSHPP